MSDVFLSGDGLIRVPQNFVRSREYFPHDRSKWITLYDSTKAPEEPACYVIFFQYWDRIKHVGYVGSTINLSKRLKAHKINHFVKVTHKDNKFMLHRTTWAYAPIMYIKYRTSSEYGDWAMMELKLIRKLKPHFNKR